MHRQILIDIFLALVDNRKRFEIYWYFFIKKREKFYII